MESLSYFAGPEPRVRYWAAYGFVFTSPNAWKNLLLGAVCFLIPVVGPMVFAGYVIEVFTARLYDESPAGAAPGYADFDFNRFVEYLTRGLWPFLVSLVVSFAVILPAYLVGFLAVFGIASSGLRGPGLGILIGACVLLFLGITFAMMLVIEPLMIRAALLQEFGPAFSVSWARDFVGRMGREMLASALFLLVTAVPLSIAGYAMCLVGVYPALALLTFAQWNLYFQVYRLYLARGGAPVPVKPPAVPPPMPSWPVGP